MASVMKQKKTSINKVVLAYSGGLDTSVAIHWLKKRCGYKVCIEMIKLTLRITESAAR